METYLTFTQINDFIFCPRSIFFHDFLRENYVPSSFKETPQILGLAAHAAIDEGRYSSRKDIMQGTTVFSARYNLLGKIDLFFKLEGRLVERKRSVTAVYDGFRYQLYAQKFALAEQGFEVKRMELYSSKDNRKYEIPLPGPEEIRQFEAVLDAIRSYRLESDSSEPNLTKCRNCNYREICTWFPEEERS